MPLTTGSAARFGTPEHPLESEVLPSRTSLATSTKISPKHAVHCTIILLTTAGQVRSRISDQILYYLVVIFVTPTFPTHVRQKNTIKPLPARYWPCAKGGMRQDPQTALLSAVGDPRWRTTSSTWTTTTERPRSVSTRLS